MLDQKSLFRGEGVDEGPEQAPESQGPDKIDVPPEERGKW